MFDAASKSKDELSINEHLFTGPCLLPLLYNILIRFRIGKYGLVADIKQAFLQICLNEQHRDFVRFLWFDDVYAPDPRIIVLRLARVVFGLTPSPFLLNATVKCHLEKYLTLLEFKRFIEKLILNLYVDDSTNSFNNISEAVEFYKKSTDALAEASFDLRKWATNSKEIQDVINLGLSNNDISQSNDKIRKVLGIRWNIQSDKFEFDFTNIISLCKNLKRTKRNILRIQGMFYDPLGLISPITLPIKCLLQDLCELKLEWDSDVNIEHLNIWQKYVKGLASVKNVSVSRQVLCCDSNYVQLHGFCDASGKAYSAAVYARVECSHGVKVSLWSGKTRLASVKDQTIPRLELMACVLLARLIVDVRDAMEKEFVVMNKDVYCWSDSMVSLWWIKQVSKVWKMWVQNRVLTVRKLVAPERWYYVPTGENPADIATRVVSPENFVKKELWWRGPEFLLCEVSHWPPQTIQVEENMTNINTEEKTLSFVTVNEVVGLGNVVDCERFGKLSTVLNVTAYVYRFVNNLKARLGKGCQIMGGELTLVEVRYSKLKWVQYEQAKIKDQNNIEKLKTSLNLFEDNDNVLRLKTRILQNDELCYSTKCPILLRNDSYFTKLVINNVHEIVYHNGTESTLNQLRKEYWVIKGRQRVKQVLKQCIVCKYVN